MKLINTSEARKEKLELRKVKGKTPRKVFLVTPTNLRDGSTRWLEYAYVWEEYLPFTKVFFKHYTKSYPTIEEQERMSWTGKV